MRLSQNEQDTIKKTVQGYDPQARVLLFGSRTDSNRKGGDIDLLVLSHQLGFREKLEILADLHGTLGEQKIDLLIDDGTGDFARSVLPTAIEL